jgi:hypothetical protein
MYDEFERAVTGKPKKGIPVFGWILITLAFLFMFGVVGVGFAAYHFSKQVRHEFSHEQASELAEELADLEIELAAELDGLDAEIAAEVAAALREVEAELGANFGEEAPRFAAGLISRMESRLGHIMGNPVAGLALIEDMGSNGYSEKALREILEGSLHIRTEDGELTADLWTGDDGGSLVIETMEGEEISIDLVKGTEGGALVIRSPENTFEFGAGSEAQGLPGWVPTARWMPDPDNMQPVFSLGSEEGSLGGVAFEVDRSPEAVLDFYRELLEDQGYELREDHSERHRGEFEGGFWAENFEDDRVVFIAAAQEDGMTKVLLGYGIEID